MKPLYRFSWILVRILARLIYRLKVKNAELMLTPGPLIIASNHISYADPPMVGISFRRAIHFMAKKELFHSRIFGSMLSRLNAHPVNRRGFDRQAIEKAMEVLESDHAMLIFPEGTRSDGIKFLPARPGIGMLARRAKAPVLPIYLHGTRRPLACFLGREKCRLICGEVISATEIEKYADDREGYKKLADEIMNRIKLLKEGHLASLE
jgi:1-acyl-sn-glycerol-3-phosphate acyltransferase